MSLGRSELIDASPWLRYGIATALVLGAALIRVGLSLVFTRPWISAPLFLLAVIISTWTGGLRLGIYSSVLSGLVLDYFFVQPLIGSLSVFDRIVRVALFLGEGSLISWLIERLRRASDAMTASREELRKLSERQRTERDAELKAISREIHDELGQALTGLKLDIHFLRLNAITQEVGSQDDVILTGLDELSRQVDSTITTVRRISSELRPSILDDFGLVAALDWLIKDFDRKSGIRCTFTSDSETVALEAEVTTALFRITQEALTNVARHAGASSASVSIKSRNGRTMLRIEDVGRGIDTEDIIGPESLGILGMRERARLIGANFQIGRSESGRTLVELSINESNVSPFAEEHEP